MTGACTDHKRASYPLELELRIVMSWELNPGLLQEEVKPCIVAHIFSPSTGKAEASALTC